MMTKNGLNLSGRIALLVSLFVAVFGTQGAAAGSTAPERAAVSLNLVPREVRIGFFFSRGKLSVEGTLPGGCDAVLILRGPQQEREMHVQGKKLGLWMTVGTAFFENVPAFYHCLTSGMAAKIMSRETAVAEGAGFQRLKEEMEVRVETGGMDQQTGTEVWKNEFVEFEKSRGLFHLGESELEVEAGPEGMTKVSGEILIPARSPVGSYRAVLLGLKDGTPVARAEETLSVDLMPSVAFLRGLAMDHGWTYGIVAVIVALGAGLGAGVISPSKGAH